MGGAFPGAAAVGVGATFAPGTGVTGAVDIGAGCFAPVAGAGVGGATPLPFGGTNVGG